MTTALQQLSRLLARRGGLRYGVEAVTQRQHALQCAGLAMGAGAPAHLVAAALLHDVGHLLGTDDLPDGLETDLDDAHEARGADWVEEHFGPSVAGPVRLHVDAKRYLCGEDPAYGDALSPTSRRSLLDQGGPMDADERARFLRLHGAVDALRLRRWDDLAKDPGARTSSFDQLGAEILVPLLRR